MTAAAFLRVSERLGYVNHIRAGFYQRSTRLGPSKGSPTVFARSDDPMEKPTSEKIGELDNHLHRTGMGASLAIAGVLTVIGAGLRSYQIRESLWVDELHTAWTVADGIATIAPRARMGNVSPLYFYFPWLATSLFGDSETALRLPSVLAGTAFIPSIFFLTLSWTRSLAAATLAGGLATIDSYLLIFALEARTYAIVQLAGLWHVALFWYVVRRPTTLVRVALILCSAFLFYLHYTAVLLLSAELAYYLLIRLGARGWPAYRPWAAALDAAAALLICAPAIGHLQIIAARRGNWAHFVEKSPVSAIFTLYPLDLYVGLPLAIVGFVVVYRWLRGRRPMVTSVDGRLLLLTLCWLFVPLLTAWILTQTDWARIFFPRYLVATAAAPIALAALVASLCPTRTTRVVLASAVLAVAVASIGPLPQWLRDGRVVRHGEEDWRAAVVAANDVQLRNLPMFVYSGLIEADGLRERPTPLLEEFCLLPIAGLYPFERAGRAVVPLPYSRAWILTADQWQLAVEARGAMFLIRGPEDFVEPFLAHLVRSFPDSSVEVTVASHQRFGHLALVRVAVNHIK